MNEYIYETMSEIGLSVSYIFMVFIMTYVYKVIYDKFTTEFDDDHEIVENSNPCVGLARAGFYLGFIWAISGPLMNQYNTEIERLIMLGIDFVLSGIVFLLGYKALARVINLDINKLSMEGNSAVGVVLFGLYISSGNILHASFSGGGADFWTGIMSSVAFNLIGILGLMLIGVIYDMVTPFNVKTELRKDNPAAGIGVAGMYISMSFILFFSIQGDFHGWKEDITSFLGCLIFGLVLLPIFRKLIDLLFLKGSDLKTEVQRDQNWPALMVVYGLLIGISVMIGMYMPF